MNAQNRRNPYQVDAWPKRPREKPQALCPQFRPCDLEGLYPVRGHCVLSRSPGWFMIPSIEEYQMFCMKAGFAQCRWFHDAGETAGPVAAPREEQPARTEAW
jgi:hypothetical protein